MTEASVFCMTMRNSFISYPRLRLLLLLQAFVFVTLNLVVLATADNNYYPLLGWILGSVRPQSYSPAAAAQLPPQVVLDTAVDSPLLLPQSLAEPLDDILDDDNTVHLAAAEGGWQRQQPGQQLISRHPPALAELDRQDVDRLVDNKDGVEVDNTEHSAAGHFDLHR